MNKAYVLCSVILLMISCKIEPLYSTMDFEYSEKFPTLYQSFLWVYQEIEYEIDISDSWQFPSTTYKYKTGDCEDKATLFLQFAKDMGYDPSIVILQKYRSRHAVTKINGKYYDPTMLIWKSDKIEGYTMYEEIPYEEVKWRCDI